MPLTLVSVPEELRARLACLGLRVGDQITLLQSTAGGGRIIAVGTTRLAIGKSLLNRLFVREYER